MSAAVRIGVIGVGDFGVRHAAVAAALAETELVAVADPDADRARSVSTRLGAAACRAIDDLLAGHDVDAVIVATPQWRHLADVTAAVAAGVHVLVEKPVVGAGDEAEALGRLVRANPAVVVMPAHVSRFLPAVAALRDRFTSRRVVSVRAIRTVPMQRLDLHGGAHPALVAMVHDLDLVRAFVPAEVREVSSIQRWTDETRPFPQIVMAHLAFEDGTVASVENHWTLPHERQYIDARLEVTTDREIGYLNVPSQALRVVAPDGDFTPDTDLDAVVAGLPVGALATQLRHFAACVTAGTPSPVVSVEDALWSVRLAASIAAQTPPR